MTVGNIFAKEALLADGWRRDVLIEIEGDLIKRVTPNTVANGADIAAGSVIPGMPNLHSHAFQRAMAGLTERRRNGKFSSSRTGVIVSLNPARIGPTPCSMRLDYRSAAPHVQRRRSTCRPSVS